MARCLVFTRERFNNNGALLVTYEDIEQSLENCTEQNADTIALSISEYEELQQSQEFLAAGMSTDVSMGVGFVCVICAVLGFRAGNAFQ